MPAMTPDSSTPCTEQWERAARAYYEEHAATACARLLAADKDALEALYHPFLGQLPPRGHILDAGCGSGRDSRVFLDRGYRVTSLDGSAAMALLASAYVGQPVLHLAFQEIAFESRFDGVWASASLLHVPRRAMPDVLRRLSRALTPGGVLYASFMVGKGEGHRGGLLFTSYREEAFAQEIARCAGSHVVGGPAQGAAPSNAFPAHVGRHPRCTSSTAGAWVSSRAKGRPAG